jgi:hypothetical protein
MLLSNVCVEKTFDFDGCQGFYHRLGVNPDCSLEAKDTSGISPIDMSLSMFTKAYTTYYLSDGYDMIEVFFEEISLF